MGYFSNLDLRLLEDYDEEATLEYRRDCLLDRYEQLMSQLNSLNSQGAVQPARCYMIDEGLRYVLPQHIDTPLAVQRAIDFVKEDLEKECDYLLFEGNDLHHSIAAIIWEKMGWCEMPIPGQLFFEIETDGLLRIAA